MTIAQRLHEKGRKEGLQQGMQQGLQRGVQQGEEKGQRDARLEIARNLLKNGASIKLIMESTGLSHEELLSLQ
ncbi:hypothetical protein [Xenorhabdus sp. TH1]|uniref:hypothetical protein n=1 Tax=Xenorhabdus sp. TH1 TaxID=3130166 RepID=UPI0030D59761